MRRSDTGAFSLLEVLVGVLILSVLSVALYFLLSTSIKSVERTEEHIVAYCLLEKVAEDLRYRLSTPKLRDDAVKLEVNNTPADQYVTKDEDFNGDGSLDDWKDMVSAMPGARDDATFADRMVKRFFITVKNAPVSAETAYLAPDAGKAHAGVKKQIYVAWKTKDGKHDRFVQMDVVQPIFSNYMKLTQGGYGDNPLFVGEGEGGTAASAFNRAYRTSLKLAQKLADWEEAAKKATEPPPGAVFRSNDFWPLDQESMLLRAHTRINVKLVLLEKVLNVSRQELISLDTKYGGAKRDLDQTEKYLTRELVEKALYGQERGQGRPATRFVQALDEMNLKCISCHSQYFFKTDPELKANANTFLPAEHRTDAVPVPPEDVNGGYPFKYKPAPGVPAYGGDFAGHIDLKTAIDWAKKFQKAESFVDPKTGAVAQDPGPVIPAEEMKDRLKGTGL